MACPLGGAWRGQEPQAQTVPVAEGRDEVQAAVHPVVLNVLAVQATLISEILLKLLVDVFSHRLPAGAGNTSRETASERRLVRSGAASSPRPGQTSHDFALPRLALLHLQGGT